MNYVGVESKMCTSSHSLNGSALHNCIQLKFDMMRTQGIGKVCSLQMGATCTYIVLLFLKYNHVYHLSTQDFPIKRVLIVTYILGLQGSKLIHYISWNFIFKINSKFRVPTILIRIFSSEGKRRYFQFISLIIYVF